VQGKEFKEDMKSELKVESYGFRVKVL